MVSLGVSNANDTCFDVETGVSATIMLLLRTGFPFRHTTLLQSHTGD